MSLLKVQKPIAIYAHPDDEIIGCSQVIHHLSDRIEVVYVTDGMPSPLTNPEYYMPHPHGESYRTMRRQEAHQALRALGLREPRQVHFLGLTDSELHLELEPLRLALQALLARLNPDTIFTHAYEGGHLDHDLVCAMVWELTTGWTGQIVETPLYRPEGDQILHNQPLARHRTWHTEVFPSSAASQARKQAAFDAYASQQVDLQYFSAGDPEHYAFIARDSIGMDSFSKPPNGGQLLYSISDLQSLGG